MSTPTETYELEQAWSIISALLNGMLISDPRWKHGADWLQRNYHIKPEVCPGCKGWPHADAEIGASPCALCTPHAPRKESNDVHG